jgi:hypothetical protein
MIVSQVFKAFLDGLNNVANTVAQNQARADATKRTKKSGGSKCTPCEAERRLQASSVRVSNLGGISQK